MGKSVRVGGANADPQLDECLCHPSVARASPRRSVRACLRTILKAGTYRTTVDLPILPRASIVTTPLGRVIRIQKKGPGGLDILVQHDGFVAIYSDLGMATPSFAQGKRSVAAGEKLGIVRRTGVTVGTHLYFEMLSAGKPVDPAPYLRVPKCGCER